MDKFKKIGLSALAGTLATLSAAEAGSMSVSGTAVVTYVQRDSNEVTGNPLGMAKDLTFDGSGELDNGWTVSVMHDLTDAAAWSNSAITIGMGSLGTLIFDQDAGKDMGSALDNVVPTAFEEADAGMATGLTLSGGAIDPNGSIVYKFPVFSGAQIGLAYNPRSTAAAPSADGGTSGGGSDSQGEAFEWAVDWSPEMVPGLRVGGAVGKCEDCMAGTLDRDEETWFATYTYGPLSIGYQVADEDDGTNTYDTDVYGVSFNVNDALSVSYQYGETDGSNAAYTTAEFKGISAAYNIGPMAIKFTDNSGKHINGSATDNDDNRELNLSMSF
jgi:outer membrane protein OmpU